MGAWNRFLGARRLAAVTVLISGPGFAGEYAPDPVQRTAQTDCYDAGGALIPCAGTGQDGFLQTGVAWPTPRFLDNKNGTVTDRLSNLIWLKDAHCASLSPSSWQDATSKVARLKSGVCGLKGRSKAGAWRLPTIKELQSLVDYRYAATGTAALANRAGTGPWREGDAFVGVTSQYYWSSTPATVETAADSAWVVDFDSGATSAERKGFAWFVWPVRKDGQVFSSDAQCKKSGFKGLGFKNQKQCRQFLATPRFRDNADGTVTDRYTQLIWLKNAFCTESPLSVPYNRADWTDALRSVALLGSGTCGLSDGSAPGDWRLPNVREMQSLVDYRYSGSFLMGGGGGPAVLDKGAAFSGIQKEYYWTSTTVTGVPDSAWLIDFNVGYITYKGVAGDIKKTAATNNDLHAVWAVRGGPVFPAARAQCKKNGWKDFGFYSQAQCVNFVKIR